MGGGEANTASGRQASVSGGSTNAATADYAWDGGGAGNNAAGVQTSIAGGTDNLAGGTDPTTIGNQSFIGGGSGNVTSGDQSAILGRPQREPWHPVRDISLIYRPGVATDHSSTGRWGGLAQTAKASTTDVFGAREADVGKVCSVTPGFRG